MAVNRSTFWKGFLTLITTLFVIPQLQAAVVADKGNTTTPATNSSSTIPRLGGVNLPGFEFGIQTNGMYTPGSQPVPPPDSQISHFLTQNVNLFRVPVAWDSLQPEPNGKLNETMVTIYRNFVEQITSKGAYAMLDVHSYGRYQGKILGQDDKADVLVSLWTQLGEVFKNNSLAIFGTSNEPHDQDIDMWAAAVQEVVTALRKASINNIIMLPGIEYTSMGAFSKWYPAMKKIKNPNGSFDGLIFELHRYLDTDNSGKSTECVSSHADEVKQVSDMLKTDNRQAILAEIGGGSTASCEKFLPEVVGAVVDAYPNFLGFAMWAAGAFDEKYELVLTVRDKNNPDEWIDQKNWLSIAPFLPKEPPSATGGSTLTKTKSKSKSNHKSRCRP